jgi:hypothetical protein
MKIWKLSKILNNKDCDMNTKPSYKEKSCTCAKDMGCILEASFKLDAFFQHIEEYKVTIANE